MLGCQVLWGANSFGTHRSQGAFLERSARRRGFSAGDASRAALNFANASTMPQWVTTNVSTRGNFLAKLSAASVIACVPVVLAGWAAQKRMIRGLSMGALK